ncbi:MAG: putative nucleic acid-binding protein [Parasphingorhabdus sp.]|jgi:predicted nucleic acid-binding protein
MSFLLDTCVVASFMKPEPSSELFNWLNSVEEERVFLSVMSLGEIQSGISRLANGQRKQNYQQWLETDFLHRFAGRLLSLGERECINWGRISGDASRRGASPGILEAQIAAIAFTHGLTLVTHHEEEFSDLPVSVLNPWQ